MAWEGTPRFDGGHEDDLINYSPGLTRETYVEEFKEEFKLPAQIGAGIGVALAHNKNKNPKKIVINKLQYIPQPFGYGSKARYEDGSFYIDRHFMNNAHAACGYGDLSPVTSDNIIDLYKDDFEEDPTHKVVTYNPNIHLNSNRLNLDDSIIKYTNGKWKLSGTVPYVRRKIFINLSFIDNDYSYGYSYGGTGYHRDDFAYSQSNDPIDDPDVEDRCIARWNYDLNLLREGVRHYLDNGWTVINIVIRMPNAEDGSGYKPSGNGSSIPFELPSWIYMHTVDNWGSRNDDSETALKNKILRWMEEACAFALDYEDPVLTESDSNRSEIMPTYLEYCICEAHAKPWTDIYYAEYVRPVMWKICDHFKNTYNWIGLGYDEAGNNYLGLYGDYISNSSRVQFFNAYWNYSGRWLMALDGVLQYFDEFFYQHEYYSLLGDIRWGHMSIPYYAWYASWEYNRYNGVSRKVV